MRVWVLGSGSRGNAVLVEAATSRVLIDAGFPPPILAARLASIEIPPASIDALVITHEHTDHIRGARGAAERFGWPVYATAGTILSTRDLRDAAAIPFRPADTFTVGDLDLTAIKSPHDAAEPVVFLATAKKTGARAGIAYDLGCITQSISETLHTLDVLILEANHDESMLHHGPYPASVRARIAGRHGHLSNQAAGKFARRASTLSLRHLVLAHLSESCNEPALAVRDVTTAVARGRFRGRVSVAPQHAVVGPFEPGVRWTTAVQLDLGV